MELWLIWLAWVMWIVNALCPDVQVIFWSALVLSGSALVLCFFSLLRKGDFYMRLLKREKDTADMRVGDNVPGGDASAPDHPASMTLCDDGGDALKMVRVRKDTFISAEVHLTGNIEGQSNVVIEGTLDGNIKSLHQVRIESGGKVSGDIHARHIVINGHAEGNFHAEAVTLQSEGRIEGTVFADELVIEKGGVFIGHSEMKDKPPALAEFRSRGASGDKKRSGVTDNAADAGTLVPKSEGKS